jgi:hypothetical protein
MRRHVSAVHNTHTHAAENHDPAQEIIIILSGLCDMGAKLLNLGSYFLRFDNKITEIKITLMLHIFLILLWSGYSFADFDQTVVTSWNESMPHFLSEISIPFSGFIFEMDFHNFVVFAFISYISWLWWWVGLMLSTDAICKFCVILVSFEWGGGFLMLHGLSRINVFDIHVNIICEKCSTCTFNWSFLFYENLPFHFQSQYRFGCIQ